MPSDANIKFNKDRAKIEWIPVKSISVVWSDSQRAYCEKHAQKISDAFDPDLFEPVKVTKPNCQGIYHVIDGQHRVSAVKKALGEEQLIPAQILDETDPARAAKIFLGINTSKKSPQSIDLFKVRCAAKDPITIAVRDIVTKNGFTIASDKRDKCISCVGALVFVYEQWGEAVLDSTLKVLRATWGTDYNAVVGPIVRGYGAFFGEFQTRRINWQRLKDVICKKYTPGSFLGAIKATKEQIGGNLTNAAKEVLIRQYNRGIKDDLKIKLEN